MAATVLTENEAAFAKQAANLGERCVAERCMAARASRLRGMRVNTSGRLAPTWTTSGRAEDDVRGLLGNAVPARAITVGDIAVMKRLSFEAQTAMIALARSQADPNADPSLRKMPVAEPSSHLAEKRKAQWKSRQTYAVINGMLEADALKYLSTHPASALRGEVTRKIRACSGILGICWCCL